MRSKSFFNTWHIFFNQNLTKIVTKKLQRLLIRSRFTRIINMFHVLLDLRGECVTDRFIFVKTILRFSSVGHSLSLSLTGRPPERINIIYLMIFREGQYSWRVTSAEWTIQYVNRSNRYMCTFMCEINLVVDDKFVLLNNYNYYM